LKRSLNKFLEKVKDDKPPFVHKIHKRQLSLGDIRQEVPAPVARSNHQTPASLFHLKEQAVGLEI
jgi:hypothetical protein